MEGVQFFFYDKVSKHNLSDKYKITQSMEGFTEFYILQLMTVSLNF